MEKVAKNFVLPSGEYFINMYKDGGTSEAHLTEAVASLDATGKTNRRMRINVTNIGEVLNIFNVD